VGWARLCPYLDNLAVRKAILIKNGYVVTIDGARNVYPSAPAAREAGASGVRQFDTSAGSDSKRKPARTEGEIRRIVWSKIYLIRLLPFPAADIDSAAV
jgi:hypothetical protein